MWIDRPLGAKVSLLGDMGIVYHPTISGSYAWSALVQDDWQNGDEPTLDLAKRQVEIALKVVRPSALEEGH